MAIALAGSVLAVNVSNGSFPMTTSAFTPETGELLVVKAITEGSPTLNTPTATGGGITWTLQINDTTADKCKVYVWTGLVTSGGSSITVSVSGTANGSANWSMRLERWTGAELDATPAILDSQGSGAPSASITTEGDNSIVTWCNGDWNANAPGTPAYRSSATAESFHDASTSFYVGYYAYQTAATAGSQTVGMTAPTGQSWNMVGIELKETPEEEVGPRVITLEGTPTLYENASSTQAVIPYPTGIVEGELLLAHICHSNNTAYSSAPVGWTFRSNKAGSTAGPSQSLFYRIATGAESGSITFTGVMGSAGRITGTMERWSGVDTGTPFDTTDVIPSMTLGTTYTVTGIDTVIPNTMRVVSIGQEASGSNDIATETGWTKINGSTGTGRRMSTFYRFKDDTDLSSDVIWDATAGSTNWTAILVALRPAPSLNTVVNDIPGVTTMVVSANTTNTTSVRLKVATDTALTTGVIFGGAQTPDANGNMDLTVTGLTANTRYYYRVAMEDSGAVEYLDDWATVGTFKTDINAALSFAIGFGSCCIASDSASMAAIVVKNPDLFLHLGDLFYADGTGSSVGNFRTQFEARLTATNHKDLCRTSGWSYIPSDHDGMNNNTTAGSHPTEWTNFNTVYREKFPDTDLPGSTGVYRSFKRGRIRFLRIDRRSLADDPADTDDATKSCLGATQLQWLKDEITNCAEPVIIIQNPDPWIVTADAGADGWDGYMTERADLGAHIAASGKHIVMLGGDMHAVGADDGTSVNNLGDMPYLAGAPLNNTASQKGGPYSEGIYPASGSASVDQYGYIIVTDNDSSIDIDFVGYSSDNTSRITLNTNFVLDTVFTATGIASAEAFGTPSVTQTLITSADGIASAEAFGTPSVTQALTTTANGIATGEAFGTPTFTAGEITAIADGIASAEAFGTPNASNNLITATANGIASAEAFGTPSVTLGAITATAEGIPSAEAFGTPEARDPESYLNIERPKHTYSTNDLEFEFYRQQSGLEAGTFNDHKWTFLRNLLGYVEDIDYLEYQYWKTLSQLPGEGFSLADHRQATFESATGGDYNDDGRTYFLQFFF